MENEQRQEVGREEKVVLSKNLPLKVLIIEDQFLHRIGYNKSGTIYLKSPELIHPFADILGYPAGEKKIEVPGDEGLNRLDRPGYGLSRRLLENMLREDGGEKWYSNRNQDYVRRAIGRPLTDEEWTSHFGRIREFKEKVLRPYYVQNADEALEDFTRLSEKGVKFIDVPYPEFEPTPQETAERIKESMESMEKGVFPRYDLLWNHLSLNTQLGHLSNIVKYTTGKEVAFTLVESLEDFSKKYQPGFFDFVLTDLGLPEDKDTLKDYFPNTNLPPSKSEEIAEQLSEVQARYPNCPKAGVRIPLDKMEELFRKGDFSYLEEGKYIGGLRIAEFLRSQQVPYTIFTADINHGTEGLVSLLANSHISAQDIAQAYLASTLFPYCLRDRPGDMSANVSFTADSGKLSIGYKSNLRSWVNTLSRVLDKCRGLNR